MPAQSNSFVNAISSNCFFSNQKLTIDSSSSTMESSWFSQTSLINLDLRLQFPSPKGVLARQADEKISVKVETAADEVEVLEAELDRVKEENKRLSETLAIMKKNYSILRTKLHEFTDADAKRKRIADQSLDGYYSISKATDDLAGEHAECPTISDEQGACKRARTMDELQECKPKISKVCVRTDPSDTTLVVKDGYQWRKYGQKVTRDNPCPRAYFRCSFAPVCEVKKKVQRSAEDKSILVATYEGEHNHDKPSHQLSAGGSRSAAAHGGGIPASDQSAATNVAAAKPKAKSPELRYDQVEQMAQSLTKDPAFKSALAAAISGRMLHFSPPRD